jgi:protein-disulfide isomerase
MTRRSTVFAILAVAIAGFAVAAALYPRTAAPPAAAAAVQLERFHSPTLGRQGAPVTIVEFFDPACEGCRAFHPIVKQILAEYPDQVRLVMRYAAFHEGSDEAVRILEAARLQNRFEPVLEALYEAQPIWANHGQPDLEAAWQAAASAGLDVTKARADAERPAIAATLKLDAEDVAAAGVEQTPTFFVNGKPLPSFGPDQLLDLVQSEIDAR